MRDPVAHADPKAAPARAGSRALSVFARVLSAQVLRAHSDGPLRSTELERRLGWAAKASLRVATIGLCELGALERGGEHALATGLTAAGRDLLNLADALERWLSDSPFGPLDLSEAAARGTIRAFVAGWESTIVQALSAGPSSLAELSATIPGHGYPVVKRRLARLRTASLVAAIDDRARSPKQVVTPLLRRVVRPLGLAARWERSHMSAAPPLDRRDLEAALHLTLPLVELPLDASGSCVLVVSADRDQADDKQSAAAVGVVAEKGRVTALDPEAVPTSTTWAMGSSDDWLEAIVTGQAGRLRLRGPDVELARLVIGRINRALFAGEVRVRLTLLKTY